MRLKHYTSTYWSGERKYKYFYWENFQVIHLPSGSFKVLVLAFLIVLHFFFFFNWYLPKWEVSSLNFESQLLCGRTTLSGRTTGTAASSAPHFRPTLATSLLFPKTSHRKPSQLHPFSSLLLPHTQSWQWRKDDNHH